MGKLYVQIDVINRDLRSHNFEGYYIINNDRIIPIGIGNKTKSFLVDWYDLDSFEDLVVVENDESEYDSMIYDDDEDEDELDSLPIDLDDKDFNAFVISQLKKEGK